MNLEHSNSISIVNNGVRSVNENEDSKKNKKQKCDLVAIPVSLRASGVGAPYAPEDWPLPGDKWTWKVGRRLSNTGYHLDRFLLPPSRYKKSMLSEGRYCLASKKLVEKFIHKEFPNIDMDAFFASFIWKIPSHKVISYEETVTDDISCSPSKDLHHDRYLECNGQIPNDRKCKVGNKMCVPYVQAMDDSSAVMDCDICCSDTGFCRDCCCILCGLTIDSTFGSYIFIKCEAKVVQNFICGHVAHLECAVRAHLAGTVGGIFDLDAEYYCRRCDNRSDLISHFAILLNTCGSLQSKDTVEKILNLGLCMLGGSEKYGAKKLHSYIESITVKFRNGVYFEEVWKMKDGTPTFATRNPHFQGDLTVMCSVATCDEESDQEKPCNTDIHHISEASTPMYIISDYYNASSKLKKNVNQVLEELKKSQESEFRLAEEKLQAQRSKLVKMYKNLDIGRSKLETSSMSDGVDSDFILSNVVHMVNDIKHEETKLNEMIERLRKSTFVISDRNQKIL